MTQPQLPHFEDGVLPTDFVQPDQAGRLTRMLELSLEQATLVSGGATVSSATSAASLTLSKFRLCRIVACRVLCQISCMVALPQQLSKTIA
jgi:hypothetical protein